MKILVTAGGTGGHIYPALALIDKFKEKEKNLDIIYVGTHNRMEKDIIPTYNIKYIPIEIYGLTKNILHDIKDLYLIKKDTNKMIKLLKEYKPDVVLGIGGYVTYPVIKAAHKLNIPIFIHEQNAIPGKVNKLVAKYADLIGVSFKDSMKYFSNKNVFYSGNPCGSRALTIPKVDKKTLGFNKDKKLITIVSGSLGSSTINKVIKDYLDNFNNDYEVLFITGNKFYDEFKDIKYPSNIKILPFYDNLPGILKSSDVLVTRAGASTIAEILSIEIPSIFIPSPYVANNHQYYNAKDMVDNNLGLMIEEKDLNKETLNNNINKLLNDTKLYNSIKESIKNSTKIDSSEIIYNKIKELLNAK